MDVEADEFSHLTIEDESREQGATEFGEKEFGESSQSFAKSKYFKEEIHSPIWFLCCI